MLLLRPGAFRNPLLWTGTGGFVCADRCLTLRLTLGVIVGLCSIGAPVTASIYQAGVVSDTAASTTPNLVTSTAVPHPHVDAVALSGQTMYAGGFFDAVSDSTRSYPRHNLVAFDASTGAVKSLFAPVFDGNVWAIATTPGAAYVGGAVTRSAAWRDPRSSSWTPVLERSTSVSTLASMADSSTSCGCGTARWSSEAAQARNSWL